MKPTIAIMLMALVFHACAPLVHISKAGAPIPCLGAIGKQRSTLFAKYFHKVGEPTLSEPIAISIQSVAFTPGQLVKYTKRQESQGKKSNISKGDSTQIQQQYYMAKISDAIGLTTQLKSSENQPIIDYLKEDKNLVMLTGISFMANEEISRQINTTGHYYINNVNGKLTLELNGNAGKYQVEMSDLQIFGFETSNFCWKRNKLGQVEIAHILMDGNSCPGETKNNPNKLDPILDYSKL
ncbi:hypothetical protein [Flagellimonas marina]|uniref:Lipoprotein n=1 Tax=Flagellimonas marina TaxID=1775168 RepID=A0ABV8PNR6_9FLAO